MSSSESRSRLAVSVRGLSKSYTIASNRAAHTTLAEAMLHRLRHPFARERQDTFWALKDVNFDIQEGDVVGIIGRNGAGKSTLLKILSRITEPTAGQVDLYGRVGSLLEVGTGFHPELTGRENIYLNGQILGMRKKEIERQFDAIVEFAGVSQFLNTPVKRYSSGMYVRLAFAVAAHLRSEILLIDEVLAVGDAEFQRKCLGKMKDLAGDGRTVLFVSHHMQSVQGLCNRAIYLEKGVHPFLGEVSEAIGRYTASFARGLSAEIEPDQRPGTGEYRIIRAWPTKPLFDAGEPKEIEFTVERRKTAVPGAYLNVVIFDAMGTQVATCDMRTDQPTCLTGARQNFLLRIRSPWLPAGEYRLMARVCNFGTVDLILDACRFSVSDIKPYKMSVNDNLAIEGIVLADYEFVEDAGK